MCHRENVVQLYRPGVVLTFHGCHRSHVHELLLYVQSATEAGEESARKGGKSGLDFLYTPLILLHSGNRITAKRRLLQRGFRYAKEEDHT